MKNLPFILLYLFVLQAQAQDWQIYNNFPAQGRYGQISEVVGNKAYLGTGSHQVNNTLKDFWEYTPQTNTWRALPDFMGISRYLAVSFTIGNDIYVGLGYNNSAGYLKDFYKYNVASETWTRIADFPSTARCFSATFTLNGKGYVVGGHIAFGATVYQDGYAYDPNSNTWSSIQNLPQNRTSATGFSYNNFGYVVGGQDGSGTTYNNMWKYDPSTNQWTSAASIPNARSSASHYKTCNKVYITCGYVSGSYTNSIVSYDPINNSWQSEPTFSGVARRTHSSFFLDGKPYILFGYNGSFLNDFGVKNIYDQLPNTIFNMTQICSNQFPITLSAPNIQSAFYLWNTGAITSSIQVNAAGEYWVSITDQCGFSKRDTIIINNLNSNLPNGIFNPDMMQVCSNQFPITLSAPNIQSVSYLWNTGSTTSSIQVNAAGEYWVSITNQCGFSKKDTIKLIDLNTPPISFDQKEYVLCESNTIKLKAPEGFTSYLWSTGATTSSILVTEAGNYWVKINNGCVEKTDTLKVTAIIDRDIIKKIPNAFTPNGDNINDSFEIPIELIDSKLEIYNRWGKRIFISDNYKNDWNGDNLKSGVYYYIITTRQKCLKPVIKGWITILK